MFCAIRSYDTFLSSAYCEGIRNLSTYVPFEEMREKLHWGRMQWPHLIDSFEDNLRPDRTLLWRFEDFRNNNDRILDALTFESSMTLAQPEGKNAEYPSYSKQTIDTLDVIATRMGIEVANKLIPAIANTFPKGDAYEAFNPWGSNEQKLMRRLYEQDCQMIDKAKWLVGDLAAAEVTQAA